MSKRPGSRRGRGGGEAELWGSTGESCERICVKGRGGGRGRAAAGDQRQRRGVGGAREPPEPPLQPGLRDRRHHLRGLHPGPPGPRRPPQPALPRRRHPRPSLIAGRQPTPGPGSLAGPSPFRSDDGSDGPACSSPPPPNPPSSTAPALQPSHTMPHPRTPRFQTGARRGPRPGSPWRAAAASAAASGPGRLRRRQGWQGRTGAPGCAPVCPLVFRQAMSNPIQRAFLGRRGQTLLGHDFFVEDFLRSFELITPIAIILRICTQAPTFALFCPRIARPRICAKARDEVHLVKAYLQHLEHPETIVPHHAPPYHARQF